jgi:hypothetical protein
VHAQGVPPLIFQSHRSNKRRDREENTFSLQTKEHFITDQFQPIEACSACVGSTHFTFQSPPLQCEATYGPKTVLASRLVPFDTDRFCPNLHSIRTMGKECQLSCLRHPAAMRGEIRKRNCFGSREKCPPLLTAFNLTCTACRACAGSIVWYSSVTPLQT